MDAKSLTRNWNYPTSVRFGPGRIAELPAVCKELGMKRPLLVTDPGLRKLPMIESALASLRNAGLGDAVFSDIRANPVGRNVDDGVAFYKAGKCDGIIAFGGGSALDVGKTIALMVGQTRPLWDFEDREDWTTRVNVAGMAQTIAVPTTAGTGSEVGRASVILDEATHVKKIIFHPRMLPAVVISDPEQSPGLRADEEKKEVAQEEAKAKTIELENFNERVNSLQTATPKGQKKLSRQKAVDTVLLIDKKITKEEKSIDIGKNAADILKDIFG